eukprot:6211098-Pleurochrysis_carterae.AAC.6
MQVRTDADDVLVQVAEASFSLFDHRVALVELERLEDRARAVADGEARRLSAQAAVLLRSREHDARVDALFFFLADKIDRC